MWPAAHGAHLTLHTHTPTCLPQQEEIAALRREAAERARGHESELQNQRKEITAAFEKVRAVVSLTRSDVCSRAHGARRLPVVLRAGVGTP